MFACKCPRHHLALSFFRSKTLLDRSKLFGTFQIISDMFNRLWQVQKWHFLVLTFFFIWPMIIQNVLNKSKMIMIGPKQFGSIQNEFGSIEEEEILLWTPKLSNCPPLTWVSNAIDRTGFKPISYRFKHTWCLTHISWCVSYSH